MTRSPSPAATDRTSSYSTARRYRNHRPLFGKGLTLIEFKRPVRDDYTDDDNPITQIYRYIDTIKDGKATDRAGRPVTIPDRTPFFAYIVCDITPTLRMQAKAAGFRQTADAAGYFGYNDNFGVYVDIISFDKLIGDAKKRNAILFEKLGLATP